MPFLVRSADGRLDETFDDRETARRAKFAFQKTFVDNLPGATAPEVTIEEVR